MWGLLFDCMSGWRSGERVEHEVLGWDGVDGWLWLARKGCVCVACSWGDVRGAVV